MKSTAGSSLLPRGSRELSSSAPEAFVAPHGSRRLPQELPQRLSRELKRPPRASQNAPEVPKSPPRAVHIAARERLGLPRQPQVSQNVPTTGVLDAALLRCLAA